MINQVTAMSERTRKYGKTQSMTVDKLDDGTYTSSMRDENGNHKKYSHGTAKDLAAHMMSEMGQEGGKKEKAKDRMMGETE